MSLAAASQAPAALRRQVRRAARLAYCLTRLSDRLDPRDPSHEWAVDREADVRSVVGSAVSGWSAGRLDADRATARIGSFVEGLEESVLAFARARARAGSRSA